MQIADVASSSTSQSLKSLEVTYETAGLNSLLDIARNSQRNSKRRSAPHVSTVVAGRPEQFEAAENLVRRRYAWRGYDLSSTAQSCTSATIDALRVTLLAQSAERLLGTLTVRPGSCGLLAEQSYGAEIQRLRHEGRRVGELVKLAMEEGADWRATLDSLVKSAYMVTRFVHALTDVVIEVNPRHARFYERVFGFMVGAAERFCTRVRAPSVLMLLDLEQFGKRIEFVKL